MSFVIHFHASKHIGILTALSLMSNIMASNRTNPDLFRIIGFPIVIILSIRSVEMRIHECNLVSGLSAFHTLFIRLLGCKTLLSGFLELFAFFVLFS
jgi:hypothetical protein